MESKNLCKTLLVEDVPNDLHSLIMGDIKNQIRKSARIRFALRSLVSCVSIFALVISVKYLVNESSATGLFDYISLMFSDVSALVSYPKELMLAILDAMPLLGVAFVSVAGAVGVWSFTKSITDARAAFLTA